MATWPTSLPTYPDDNGFTEGFGALLKISQTDIGPTKVRRLTTSAPKQIKAVYTLTGTQLTTLTSFFLGSISGGADSFYWPHPRTETNVEVVLTSTPQGRNVGYDRYTVELDLETVLS